MTKKRKKYTPEAKIKLLREHLVEGTPVSRVLCIFAQKYTLAGRIERFSAVAVVSLSGKE